MGSFESLFRPVRIGAREMKNRLAKTATGETRASVDGFVTEEYVDWYRRIAEGGIGLIHTGVVYTMLKGKAGPHVPGLDSDDKITGWKKAADTVHKYGCLLLAQIHHPGRQMVPVPNMGHNNPVEVVAPSPVRSLISWIKPREMTVSEIEELISSFGAAARRAQSAGLDGVQIHAAHGYLIHAFISGRTNRRTDSYGGSFNGRIRVLEEIVKAVRRETGDGFLVTVKMNSIDGFPWRGINLNNVTELATRVAGMDIDALEVSCGTYEYPRTVIGTSTMVPLALTVGLGSYLPAPMKILARIINPLLKMIFHYREGFNMAAVRKIRAAVGKPIICMGGFHTPEVMNAVIERGEGDIIAMGRQIIADPEFPNKIRNGGNGIKWCSYCNNCISLAGLKPANCYKDKDFQQVFPPVDQGIRDV